MDLADRDCLDIISDPGGKVTEQKNQDVLKEWYHLAKQTPRVGKS